MPMPMQISLDEVLSMLLSRVDAMTMANENMKSKFNILARALYKKGLLNDDDILQSVKDEHQLLVDLGAIKSMPDEATLKSIADNVTQWVKNDAEAIKKSMMEYEAKVKAMIEKKKKDGWEFLFIGANIDAVTTAATFGIDESRAVDYRADAKGTRVLYSAVGSAITKMRKCAKISEDWAEEICEDYNSRK
ncbi:MAG: hypothetical protein IKN36_08945 [Clostridia bacterium]|nr:hypothetical protein [Clostridia bacterium]